MCPFFPVAVGADPQAHAGSAEADAATIFITTAFDVPLTRSVITVRVADDYALVAAFTPATAVFVAYHADVLDVAVRGYRLIGSERCSSGGGCEERTCAHCERDCYLVHHVLQTGVSKCQTASPLLCSNSNWGTLLLDILVNTVARRDVIQSQINYLLRGQITSLFAIIGNLFSADCLCSHLYPSPKELS